VDNSTRNIGGRNLNYAGVALKYGRQGVTFHGSYRLTAKAVLVVAKWFGGLGRQCPRQSGGRQDFSTTVGVRATSKSRTCE